MVEKVTFGSTRSDQTHLAKLVKKGIKIATSSLLFLQELGINKRTHTNDIWNIFDGEQNLVCTVQVIDVSYRKYSCITNKFAIHEGDNTLENWINIHEPYYSNILSRYGIKLDKDTVLECVYFKLIDPID